MKFSSTRLFPALLAYLFAVLSTSYAAAESVEFISVTPAGPTVFVTFPQQVNLTNNAEDTLYTATFNTTSQPICTARGAKISSCVFDEGSQVLTMTYTFTSSLIDGCDLQFRLSGSKR